MWSILNELSDYLADWSYPIQMILTDDIKCFLSQFTNRKDQRRWVMWKSLTFINLCFVAIVNKAIFFPGDIHWHPLKVFKSHVAMQKVILHLEGNSRKLYTGIYNIIIVICQCLQVFTVFCICNQPHSSSILCSYKKHKHCHWDNDPQHMTNINLKTCIETLSTIYSYSTTVLF